MNTTPSENPTLDEILDRLDKASRGIPTGPSPSELALVAATLARNDSTKPSEKLIEARELIREADKLLHPKDPPRLPFNTLLEQLMPTIKGRAYREKKFFDYLQFRVRRWRVNECSAVEIQRMAQAYLDTIKAQGEMLVAFCDFAQWQKDDLRRKRSASGRMGGISKKQTADAEAKKQAKAKEAKKRKRMKPRLAFPGDDKLDGLAAGTESLPD
jgi:hypothetical protein